MSANMWTCNAGHRAIARRDRDQSRAGAFWQPRSPRQFLALFAAIPLLSLTFADGHAARARLSDSDSVRTVRRVTISERGVVIEHSGPDGAKDTLKADGVIDVSRKHVRIRRDRDTQRDRRVSINGPNVTVDDEAGLVRVFSDAEVPAGERVEGDVVAVVGSVVVEGQVAGDVVAVLGSVTLKPGAVVDGDVVAIGGALDQAVGAIVSGESVSVGFLTFGNGVPTVGTLLLAIFTGWFISLLMAWFLILFFPSRMLHVAMTASQRTAGSFGLGVLSAPLVMFAICLLLVTVIGIPFALVLPLVYVLIVWGGQLAVTQLLGCRLLRRPLGQVSPMTGILAGSLLVALLFVLGVLLSRPEGSIRTIALFFHLLGALLLLGLSIIGTGAVLLSRFGSRPREGETAMMAPAVNGGLLPGSTPSSTLPPAVPGS
jgi:cytoskeletal protein CcmA (bactofilin family)